MLKCKGFINTRDIHHITKCTNPGHHRLIWQCLVGHHLINMLLWGLLHHINTHQLVLMGLDLLRPHRVLILIPCMPRTMALFPLLMEQQ